MARPRKLRLTDDRKSFKPFHYPWAYDLWLEHEKIHWTHSEVPLIEDMKDWTTRLTETEKYILTQIFRFFTQCLSKDHEILTSKGWKNVADVEGTDLIAEVDVDGIIHFLLPKVLYKYPFAGNLVQLTNETGTVNCAITDNHKVAYRHHEIIEHELAKDIVLDSKLNFVNSVVTVSEGLIDELTNLERYKIAYQTSGYVSMSGEIFYIAVKGTEKTERLKSILDATKIDFEIQYKDNLTVFKTFPLSDQQPDLELKWIDVSDKSTKYCRNFLNEVSDWDKIIPLTQIRQYVTTNKKVIDQLQMVLALADCHNILQTNPFNSSEQPTKYVLSWDFSRKGEITCESVVKKEVPYDGFVYCVTTKSGYFITRKDGAICVTGNSDLDVAGAYVTNYLPFFPQPEVRMMLLGFAARECFDKETEVLTDRGWIPFPEADDSYLYAQYDINNKTTSFAKPISMIKKRYTGVLHHYNSKVIDICCTPGHELIITKIGTTNTRKVKSEDYILGENYMCPVSSSTSSIEEFTDDIKIKDSILIMIQADGSVRSQCPSSLINRPNEKRCYVILTKPRKIDRARKLLNNSMINWDEFPHKNGITFSIVVDWTAQDDINSLNWINIQGFSVDRLANIMEEISYWDSSSPSTNDTSSFVYYNTNRKAVDKLSMVGALCGYRTIIGINRHPVENLQIHDNRYPTPTTKTCYSLSVVKTSVSTYPHNTDVDYDDYVYCVEVPHSNIITRRNGRVALASNCGHIAAYSHLIETIGMPERIYNEFLEYKEMKDKHDYIESFIAKDATNIAQQIAVFSAFTEGLQLFSSFIFLLNFPRHGKMRGMGQIISWSIIDESCVIEGTEVLTPLGWRNIEDITLYDQVMQYDMTNDGLSFTAPTRLIHSTKTESYIFESSDFYQHTTDDHRMITNNDGIIDSVLAKDVTDINNLKLTGNKSGIKHNLSPDDKNMLDEILLGHYSEVWIYAQLPVIDSNWAEESVSHFLNNYKAAYPCRDKDVIESVTTLANVAGGIINNGEFVKKSTTKVKKTHITHEPKKFYCLSVHGKAFLIKSKGKISITGNCHVEGMTRLFRTFIEENRDIWNDKLKGELYTIAKTMVDLEDKFIDLTFAQGELENLSNAEVKLYIRYICDRRLIGLGLKGIFKVKKNPLPWVDEMINLPIHGNFFENRIIEYSKGALSGSWNDVWKTNKVIENKG